MFHFSFEPARGILRVEVVGAWTMAEVERYAQEAGVQFSTARKAAGRLRLLVDLSATAILSQSIIEPLAKAGMQYSRPDDRVTIVVASTLLKLQMKRMVGDAPVPIFVSTQEAAEWLVRPEETQS